MTCMKNQVNVKVVLLGLTDAGKTCILERYIYNRYSGDKGNMRRPKQTVGVVFTAHLVVTKGKNIVLNIWDTAGQERFRALTMCYYRNAAAAIICYDVSDRASWVCAKRWLEEVKNNEENCSIYICGTKLDILADGSRARVIDYDAAYKYAQGMNFHVKYDGIPIVAVALI